MQIAHKDVWNKKNGEYVSYYVCGKRGCKVHGRLFQSYVLVCVCVVNCGLADRRE